ncbi:hypothetical protein JZ751_022304 [Albula glossodonta]|uniref:Uncharacterized protein n=1 Tax=Albula glossodonta TaxID=121402 RepID=A0A8T2MQR3_9TELE|nr:hypothetical protein JZ751_022304 [Albula glossodonta]
MCPSPTAPPKKLGSASEGLIHVLEPCPMSGAEFPGGLGGRRALGPGSRGARILCSGLGGLDLLSTKLFNRFDSESDIEENVSETEDNVKEDPDDEASSSDRMRALANTGVNDISDIKDIAEKHLNSGSEYKPSAEESCSSSESEVNQRRVKPSTSSKTQISLKKICGTGDDGK